MNLLDIVAAKFNVHPVLVFAYAYHYNEVRVHHQNIGKLFIAYCDNHVMPDFVADFCLDVLADRIEFPKPYFPQKRLRERND